MSSDKNKPVLSGPPLGTVKAPENDSPAVKALNNAHDTRSDEVHAIIDKAAADLKKIGVKFFIGAIDRQPQAIDGGKAYSLADLQGEDFVHILDMALPTRQDAVNLGIWVGHLINARSKNKS